MISYSEYYRQRLDAQKRRLDELDKPQIPSIIGKKRKYEEAFDYQNDYEIVQTPELFQTNRGKNWIDAYLENLSNIKK